MSTGTMGLTPGMFTGLERATPRAAVVSTSTVSASDSDELDLGTSMKINIKPSNCQQNYVNARKFVNVCFCNIKLISVL